MKTRLAVLGTAALAALLPLAACSTNEQANPAPTSGASNSAAPSAEAQVLTIGFDNPDTINPVAEAFTKATGIQVTVIASGGQGYEEFMRTRLAAGTAPDVLRVFPGMGGNAMTVGQLAKVGVLNDLSSSSWVGELNASQKTLFADSEGKILAVPVGATGLAPVWNDKALAEIGASIPATYEDLLTLCGTAKAQGKVAFALGFKDLWVTQLTPYVMLATSLNGPDPEFASRMLAGEATFTDSPWVQAFQDLLDMRAAGCFQEGELGTSWDEAMKMMGSGEALAQVTFTDVSKQQEAGGADATFTMAPWPARAGAEAYLAVADSAGFGIWSEAKNPEAAQKFLEWLASEEGQNAYAVSLGGVPSLPNSAFTTDNKLAQTVAEYVASGKTAIWPDQMWPVPELADAHFTGVQNLFIGSETPEGLTAKLDEIFKTGL